MNLSCGADAASFLQQSNLQEGLDTCKEVQLSCPVSLRLMTEGTHTQSCRDFVGHKRAINSFPQCCQLSLLLPTVRSDTSLPALLIALPVLQE